MKQSLMILTGIAYNYYNKRSNFALLGFLDEETKVFTGIELRDEEDNFSDFHQIGRYLPRARYVCGLKEEKFQYMSLDPRLGQICFSSISKQDDSGYYGNETVVYAGEKPLHQNSSLIFGGEEYYFCDDQLEAMVSVALSSQEVNPDWRKVQVIVEERARIEYQKSKGFLGTYGNVSDR